MIRIGQCKVDIEDQRSLETIAAEFLRIPVKDIKKTEIHKRSIDARDKDHLLYVYALNVTAKDELRLLKKFEKKGVLPVSPNPYVFPEISVNRKPAMSPVIVGSGPAGLFAAYELAKAGYKPILIERGKEMSARKADVRKFWEGGVLNPESNVQFGEGGAGTFSDGKLNTMIKDPTGRIRHVMETFIEHGADPSILYENKPHIGTDVLEKVIPSMRNRIRDWGGQVFFEAKMTGILKANGRLTGVKYVKEGKEEIIETDTCILAIGHSARDTFRILSKEGLLMEPKAFAVGYRMEHPQEMIQTSQYGPKGSLLAPASYKVTAQTKRNRGVYSFCMCPGGVVVNASSEKGRLAVNGMSYRARDRRNANSAIVVTVKPEDFQHWRQENQSDSRWEREEESDLFAGMEFQGWIERKAFEEAGGAVPIQRFDDFCQNRISSAFGEVIPDIAGERAFGNMRNILPEELNLAIAEGILSFGRKIKGFDRGDAILSGVESRTSSPLRMIRNEHMESSIQGLYPCGEGAGYAGGITSAAIDGIKVSEEIVKREE